MASNLGTVFVEVSLDDKVYKQKLSEIKPQTEATAKGLETSWKSLGVKTNQYFDDSRRAAENAYSLILKSGKYTADELVRAEEAKNAKIKQFNEQQYGSSILSIDNLKKHWIAATAIIGTAIGAMYKAWDLAEQGAGYLEQMQLLDGLAKKYNTSSGTIVGSIKTVSEGMINMKTAAEVATSALAKGLSAEQVINLSEAAVTLSDVMGTTANEAFIRLSTAMETGKEKSIKLAVGVIDLKEKYGLAADKMTEAEKRQALYNIVIEKTKEIQDRTGASTMSISDKMEAFKATIENVKIELGVGLVRAGAGAIGMFQWLASSVLTVGSVIPLAIEYMSKLSAKFYEFTGQTERAKAMNAEAASWAQTYKAAQGAAEELAGKAAANFSLMTASTNELTSAQNKTAASTRALGDAATGRYEREKAAAEAAKKAEQEREAATKQITEAIRKSNIEINSSAEATFEKELARIESEKAEWQKKGVDKATVSKWEANEISKVTTKFAQSDFDFYLKLEKEKTQLSEKAVKAAEKTAKEKSKYERDIYKDMRGYEVEAYNETVKLINEQAKKYKKLGVDEVAVNKWVAEETRKAELKKAEYSDDFMDGVKAGLKDIQAQTKSCGDIGLSTVKSFASNASSTLSNVFFDAYKGQLKSASDYFKSFSDGIVKSFTDSLGKMVADAAAKKIGMVFDADWTDGAISVLSTIGKVLGYATDWFFDSSGGMDSSWGADGDYTFAYGGRVPGYASGGNSPANDTVRAWLSPGEYVVDREKMQAIAAQGQRGDTMLAHINPVEAALLKALGGAGTINSKTGLPQFYPTYDSYKKASGVDDYQAAINYISEAIISGKLQEALQYIDPTGYPLYGTLGKFTTQSPTPIPSAYLGWSPWWGTVGEPIINRNSNIFSLSPDENERGRAGNRLSEGTFLLNPLDPFNMVKISKNIYDFTPQDIYGNAWPNPYLYNNDWIVENPGLDPYTGKPWSKGIIALVGYNNAYFSQFGGRSGGGLTGSLFKGLTAAVLTALSGYGGYVAMGGAAASSALSSTAAIEMTAAETAALTTTQTIASVLGGAAGGLAGSVPSAVESRNWLNLLYGTGAGALGGYLFGMSDLTLSTLGKSTIGDMAKKLAITQAFKMIFPSVSSGSLNIKYKGSSDDGLLADIAGLMSGMAKPREFAFPAKNGLDYVPRDNFKINAHEGEALLKKNEAAAYRAGKRGGNDGAAQPLVIMIPVNLNGREICKVVYDETKSGVKAVHQRGITNI